MGNNVVQVCTCCSFYLKIWKIIKINANVKFSSYNSVTSASFVH